jgi:hypothetical protein
MADPLPNRDSRADASRATGTPRWVKVFGVIALVLILLVVVMLVIGGNHGPGRHASSGEAMGARPPRA